MSAFHEELRVLELKVGSEVAALDAQPFGIDIVAQAVETIVRAVKFPVTVEIKRRSGGPCGDVLDVTWRWNLGRTYYSLLPRRQGYFCTYQHSADTDEVFAISTSRAAWYACNRPFARSPEDDLLLATHRAEVQAECDAWTAKRKKERKIDAELAELAALIESGETNPEALERMAKLMGQSDPNQF